MSFPGKGIFGHNAGYGSIRTCQPTDPFAIMNPYSRHHTAPVKTQDSLGSYEKKSNQLEMNAQAQLHKLLPNEKLVVVARAGKLLFYAVALPPYILLYGIPRWITADLMVFLSLQLNKNWGKGQELLQKVLKAITDRTDGFVDFKNKLVSGTEKIVEYLRSISKISADLLANLKHDVIYQTYQILEALGWAQDLQKGVEKFVEYAKNISSETFRFTQDQLKDLKATLENVLRPGFEQLIKRLEQIKREVNKAYGIASDVKKQAQAQLDKALEQAKQIVGAIQAFVQQTAEPYGKWLSEKSEVLQESFKKHKDKVAKVVNKRIEETQQLIQTASQAVTQVVVPVVHQMMAIPHQMINLLAVPLQNQFKVGSVIQMAQAKLRDWKENLKNLYQGFGGMKQKAQQKLAEIAQKVKEQASRWKEKGLQWLIQAKDRAWTLIKSLPAKIWKMTLDGLKAAAHFLHLTWIWTKVLTRYAMQLMRETSQELVIWLDSRPFYPRG